MGKWCLHASSFIFDRIIIKVTGNQDLHKSSDEFYFGPLVSMAHLYVFFFFFFFNEIWPLHIGLRWAIVALWATCSSCDDGVHTKHRRCYKRKHVPTKSCTGKVLRTRILWWLSLQNKKNCGETIFSEQFRKLSNRYKRIWYNPYVIWPMTACLVINPASIDSYASLFNCTAAGASDSMTTST